MIDIYNVAKNLANLYGELAKRLDDSAEKEEIEKKAKIYQDAAEGKPNSVRNKSITELELDLDYVNKRLNLASTSGPGASTQTAGDRGINIGGDAEGNFNSGNHNSSVYVGPHSKGNSISQVINEFKPPHWLITAGGLLLVMGSFLTWISSTLGGHSVLLPFFLEQTGFQILGGPIALISGVLTITLAIAPMQKDKKVQALQAISLLSLACSIISCWLKWQDLRNQLKAHNDWAVIDTNDANVLSPGPGLIIVVVGGILVLIGAAALSGSSSEN